MTELFAISRNRDSLRKAVGFWSGTEVYFNPTPDIVLLNSSLSIEMVRRLKNEYLSARVKGVIDNYVERLWLQQGQDTIACLRSGPFKDYISFTKLFERFCANHESREGSIPRSANGLANLLVEMYSDDASRKAALIQLTTDSILADPTCVHYQRYSGWLLTMYHPWLERTLLRWEKRNLAIEDALAIISTTGWHLQWEKERRNPEQNVSKVKAILDLYEDSEMAIKGPVNSTTVCVTRNYALACKQLLGMLVEQHHLLLPPAQEMPAVVANDHRMQKFEHPLHKSGQRCFITRLLASSTIVSPRDVPGNVRDWVYDFIPDSRSLNSSLSHLLRDYGIKHGLETFPLKGLHGIKARGGSRTPKWSVEWLREHGVPDSWLQFTTLLKESFQGSQGSLDTMVRPIMEWAWFERRFASPADISHLDIRNLRQPDLQTTFYHHLKKKEDLADKFAVWANAAYGFRLVFNTAKVSGDDLLLPENPFQYLENPFNMHPKDKTPRRRLPENVHEAMIEVLLSPDENGVPTYEFVKNKLRWDWYKKLNPVNGLYEDLWCPSRAACLAALLLLPMRSKQARWMDEGLLDSMIWDVEQDKFVKNTHPLAKWTYPNGKTHREVYRRYSGALQPVDDPFLSEKHLGIFVTTNKTQLWDPTRKSGHEIQWPRGDELRHSNDDVLRAQAAWLRRPYTVLTEQRRWLAANDPDPIPVTFLDDRNELNSVNHVLAADYPYFTPLFRDMTDPFYRADHSAMYLPVRPEKVARLFSALAVETEMRLREAGVNITLTQKSESSRAQDGRLSIVDIHSLRVAGISRMIEMGVPVHIIQEYIVGHKTMVMTLHYGKHEPGYVRSVLLNATRNIGTWLDWDAKVADLTEKQPPVIVTNPKYRDVGADTVLDKDVFIGWKWIDGGLCPMGGTACDIGGVVENVESESKSKKTIWGPVVGGCGNCRFFCSGPAFILQQAQTINEIMLQMRTIGKQRRDLHNRLNELTWQDDNIADQSAIGRELNCLKEQIRELDRKLEPLILEWYNRYLVLEESRALLATKAVPSNDETGGEMSRTLVSSSNAGDIASEVEARASRAGDFALVRQILEAAWIRGGIEKASELPKSMMREFMDRILIHESPKHLLISIQNEQERNRAALMLAEALSSLVGDDVIDDALESGKRLHIESKEVRNRLEHTVKTLFAEIRKAGSDRKVKSSNPEKMMILELDV